MARSAMVNKAFCAVAAWLALSAVQTWVQPSTFASPRGAPPTQLSSPSAGTAGASTRAAAPDAALTAVVAGAALAACAAGAARARKVRVARQAEFQFTGVCEQTGVTLNRYMIEMTKRGVIDRDMQSIFNSIREATKVIAKLVNRAPLSQAELLGLQGEVNVQGEDQKKLDVITNDVLKRALAYCGKLGTMASEEEDEPVAGTTARMDPVMSETGKYVCVFDPLDGSSNVDAGIPVGTIFGIFKEPEECDVPGEVFGDLSEEQIQCLAGALQPGKALVAAGYVLYSASTEMVFTIGQGCIGMTLDQTIGEYVVTRPSIKIPARGKIYSMNEGNSEEWDAPMQEYITAIQTGKGETGKPYSLRYIGSMVGDVHRTLLYGGLFAYPADKKNLDGKLRLLYEAAPMAFIVEQAGGKAITGHSRVMEIPPVGVHQRVPVILGSTDDVNECQKFFEKSDDPALKARCENRLKGLATKAAA